MTKEEFKSATWRYGMKVRHNGKIVELKSVLFDRFRLVVSSDICSQLTLKCEVCEIQDEKDL